MKTLEDARRLRSGILGAFEMAEASQDPAERDAWLTFVVVGGGPTGVELTGRSRCSPREILRRDYRSIDTTSARIVLVEHGPAVLGTPERLRDRAARDLRDLGADVRLGTAAVAIDRPALTSRAPTAGSGSRRGR